MAQFIRFGIVGVSNTVISYLIYSGSLLFFQKFGLFPSFDYAVAQFIAFLLSVLWSYYWNQKKVFTIEEGQVRSFWGSLLKTYVSYAFTGLLLSTALLYFWIEIIHISDFIAPLINLTITVPLNFLLNKFWAFRTKDENKND